MVECYDMDDDSNPKDLSKQEYIGSVELQLHQLVTARD